MFVEDGIPPPDRHCSKHQETTWAFLRVASGNVLKLIFWAVPEYMFIFLIASSHPPLHG
jgi:hypothetical protein